MFPEYEEEDSEFKKEKQAKREEAPDRIKPHPKIPPYKTKEEAIEDFLKAREKGDKDTYELERLENMSDDEWDYYYREENIRRGRMRQRRKKRHIKLYLFGTIIFCTFVAAYGADYPDSFLGRFMDSFNKMCDDYWDYYYGVDDFRMKGRVCLPNKSVYGRPYTMIVDISAMMTHSFEQRGNDITRVYMYRRTGLDFFFANLIDGGFDIVCYSQWDNMENWPELFKLDPTQMAITHYKFRRSGVRDSQPNNNSIHEFTGDFELLNRDPKTVVFVDCKEQVDEYKHPNVVFVRPIDITNADDILPMLAVYLKDLGEKRVEDLRPYLVPLKQSRNLQATLRELTKDIPVKVDQTAYQYRERLAPEAQQQQPTKQKQKGIFDMLGLGGQK